MDDILPEKQLELENQETDGTIYLDTLLKQYLAKDEEAEMLKVLAECFPVSPKANMPSH